MSIENIERRDVLGGLGLGLGLFGAGTAGAALPRNASSETPDEKKLIAFVDEFCAAWSARDVEKLIPYLAPDIEYHMYEGAEPIHGHDQFRARLREFIGDQKRIEWVTSRRFALQDVVINERVDHFIRRDGSSKPDNHFDVIGVFLVRGGKIKYWKDYTAKPA